MGNIFEYLEWRGDLPFSQSPLNPVDNIIICQLSYLPLDGIVPGPDEKEAVPLSLAAALFKGKYEKNTSDIRASVMFKEDPALLGILGCCNRFKDCKLSGYVNHIDTVREIQFAALCIDTGDNSTFVVFRGTDLSLVGWKEDFNMAFKDVIPAQLEAAAYLEKMASMIRGPLRVGGHSKGGNLAVYASANCSKRYQNRITDIYINDAPGFHEDFLESDGFLKIKRRIRSFVPQSSIVGMFFETSCEHTVIKSSKEGLLQHLLYSWEVSYNNMVLAEELAHSSRFVSKTLKDWLSTLDNEHLEIFTNTLYSILRASEASTLTDIEKSGITAAAKMIKSLGTMDEDTKQFIRKTFKELFFIARKNADSLVKKRVENEITQRFGDKEDYLGEDDLSMLV